MVRGRWQEKMGRGKAGRGVRDEGEGVAREADGKRKGRDGAGERMGMCGWDEVGRRRRFGEGARGGNVAERALSHSGRRACSLD